MQKPLMPPTPLVQSNYAADIAALRAKCALMPSSGPVKTRRGDRGSTNGRFVFGDRNGIIYAVAADGSLYWYKHLGSTDGSNKWSFSGTPKLVGSGWQYFKKIFAGGAGVIYAIDGAGNLLWYKNTGWATGTASWDPNSGRVIGTGWNFFGDRVFATTTGDGVIYGVGPNDGNLYWYKHLGRDDGTGSWAASSQIGASGWNSFSKLATGDDGAIYGIDANQNLHWYRHTGVATGAATWASNFGNQIGQKWPISTLFTGATGRIYALSGNADLQWYNHLGYLDGTATWTDSDPRVVNSAWNFLRVPVP